MSNSTITHHNSSISILNCMLLQPVLDSETTGVLSASVDACCLLGGRALSHNPWGIEISAVFVKAWESTVTSLLKDTLVKRHYF